MTKKEKMIDQLPYKGATPWYRFWKRTIDIFVSFTLILFLSLPLFVIWLVVRLSSPGKGIFKDERVGKDDKNIGVYKFRTMYADAETNLEKYLTKEQIRDWESERKVDNDPRITPVGNFLRKTSLDELPQLFNILFGTMSLVGPRPITRWELESHFTYEQKKILLSCRPGLIGYWGVMGRSDVPFDYGRQELELNYFKLRGLWFDLLLLFRVIPAVFKGRGAK